MHIFQEFEEWYSRLAERSRQIVQSQIFDLLVIVCIVVAGAIIGLRTYPIFSNNAILGTLDLAVFMVFATEIVLKIVAEDDVPLRFFLGDDWKWNNFDTIVVLFSAPNLAVGAGQVKLLRLARLLRLMKLLKKVPQLEMIIKGLSRGLGSIVYIGLLMVIVFYLYAEVGIMIFSGNDPWHFSRVELVMINLLRVATADVRS